MLANPNPVQCLGADISHHGDQASLMQLVGGKFYFEDFPGNTMLNTPGNIAKYPFFGMLVLDFESGDIIQLAAKTIIEEYT